MKRQIQKQNKDLHWKQGMRKRIKAYIKTLIRNQTGEHIRKQTSEETRWRQIFKQMHSVMNATFALQGHVRCPKGKFMAAFT